MTELECIISSHCKYNGPGELKSLNVLLLHFVAIILLAKDKSYDKANDMGLNYTNTEKFVLLQKGTDIRLVERYK